MKARVEDDYVQCRMERDEERGNMREEEDEKGGGGHKK